MWEHAKHARLTVAWALGLVFAMGAVGCDKQKAESPAGTPSGSASNAPADPAPAPSASLDAAAAPTKTGGTPTKTPTGWRMPHGWKAYDGKTRTELADAPTAASATVYSSAGKAVALSSFWSKGKTVLVFYRGHW